MILIMCARLIEIRGGNIFDNCQFLDWNGEIIPDIAKRFAVKEFVNTFDGFPERSMLTNEYAWPLRPEAKRAVRTESSSAATESDAQSLEEQSTRKRSAPWGTAEPSIVKKRFEMHEHAAKTAARVAYGVRERSASCDSKHTDCERLLNSTLDNSAPWRRRL